MTDLCETCWGKERFTPGVMSEGEKLTIFEFLAKNRKEEGGPGTSLKPIGKPSPTSPVEQLQEEAELGDSNALSTVGKTIDGVDGPPGGPPAAEAIDNADEAGAKDTWDKPPTEENHEDTSEVESAVSAAVSKIGDEITYTNTNRVRAGGR